MVGSPWHTRRFLRGGSLEGHWTGQICPVVDAECTRAFSNKRSEYVAYNVTRLRKNAFLCGSLGSSDILNQPARELQQVAMVLGVWCTPQQPPPSPCHPAAMPRPPASLIGVRHQEDSTVHTLMSFCSSLHRSFVAMYRSSLSQLLVFSSRPFKVALIPPPLLLLPPARPDMLVVLCDSNSNRREATRPCSSVSHVSFVEHIQAGGGGGGSNGEGG